MSEHLLVFCLVWTPLLTLGLRWGFLESEKARCGLSAFLHARARLARENREVLTTLECKNGIREVIRLKPLDAIHDRGPPLWDLEVRRALSLWAPLWRSSPSSPEPDSGTNRSTFVRLPSVNSRSIDAPERPDSGFATSSANWTPPANASTPD